MTILPGRTYKFRVEYKSDVSPFLEAYVYSHGENEEEARQHAFSRINHYLVDVSKYVSGLTNMPQE